MSYDTALVAELTTWFDALVERRAQAQHVETGEPLIKTRRETREEVLTTLGVEIDAMRKE
jgi:hypothetical protein